MKYLKILMTIFVLTSAQVSAQTNPSNKISVEVDPVAYVLKGYSLHGVYQTCKLSFDFGNWNVEEPEWFSGNKGFNERTNGFGVMASYHFDGIKGWFAGIGTDYSFLHVIYNQTGTSSTGHSIGIGPHIGYRFFLQKDKEGNPKGFYIKPWLSVGYSFQNDRVRFDNVDYKQQRISYFPAVHFGYSF